jgi:hypothetical protein
LSELAQREETLSGLLLAVRLGGASRSGGALVVLIVVGAGERWGESSAGDERVGEEGPREGKVGGEGSVGEGEEEDGEGGRGGADGGVELAVGGERRGEKWQEGKWKKEEEKGQRRFVERREKRHDALELEESKVGKNVVLVVGELLLEVVLEQVNV